MSKHGDRLEDIIALFLSPRHHIRGLVVLINDQIYSASYNCPLHRSILEKITEIVFKKFNIWMNYIIVSAVLIIIAIIILLINF